MAEGKRKGSQTGRREGGTKMKNVGIAVLLILFLGCLTLGYLWQDESKKYDEFEKFHIEMVQGLKDAANVPPDTIVKEVVTVKDSVIYRYVTEFKDPPENAKLFRDSLVNDSIDVRVDILANEVYQIEWAFKPVYKYQEKEIHIPKPYPVIQEREVKVDNSGFFIDAGLGFSDSFVVGGGITYIHKNRASYGLKYINYSGNNIYLVTYGVNISR